MSWSMPAERAVHERTWMAFPREGQTLGDALAGKSGAIRNLSVALPGAPANAAVSGPFSIDAEKRVSGDFTVVVTDIEGIVTLVSTAAPQLEGVAGSIASAAGFVGRTENGKTTLQITVREGKASLGIIPLGQIPRLD